MKKMFKLLLLLLIISIFITTIFKFIKYPELFLTTWKYQLKNDIEAGNMEAIEYYQTTYVNNGIELWRD